MFVLFLVCGWVVYRVGCVSLSSTYDYVKSNQFDQFCISCVFSWISDQLAEEC